MPHLVQTLSGKRRNTDLPSATKTNRRTKLRNIVSGFLPDTGQTFQTLAKGGKNIGNLCAPGPPNLQKHCVWHPCWLPLTSNAWLNQPTGDACSLNQTAEATVLVSEIFWAPMSLEGFHFTNGKYPVLPRCFGTNSPCKVVAARALTFAPAVCVVFKDDRVRHCWIFHPPRDVYENAPRCPWE